MAFISSTMTSPSHTHTHTALTCGVGSVLIKFITPGKFRGQEEDRPGWLVSKCWGWGKKKGVRPEMWDQKVSFDHSP